MTDKQEIIKKIQKHFKEFESQVGTFNLTACMDHERQNQRDDKIYKRGKSIRALIDQILLLPGLTNDDTKRFKLLKAYVLYLEMQTMYSGQNCEQADELRVAIELQEMTKEYGEKPEAIRMYIWAVKKVGAVWMKKEKWLKALPILKRCEDSLTRYYENYKKVEPWGGHEYLKCIDMKLHFLLTPFDRTINLLANMLAGCLFCVYGNLTPPDYENGLKYGVPKLRAFFELDPIHGMEIFLDKVVEVIHAMIDGSAYKQADHLLTVAMHQSAIMRRRIHINDRMNMNGRQGRLSVAFAYWGSTIVSRSMEKMNGAKNVPEPRMKPYDELKDLIQDGHNLYAHQFPIKLITDKAEAEKYLKRAKTWAKRASAMLRTCTCECDHQCKKEIDELEKKYFS